MEIDDKNDRSAPLHEALRREVVKRLTVSIFTGETPANKRLIAKRLAEELGVSATPIREALVELEAIGLVELAHNRGAVVKPFGRQQLREIYQLRRILETEATRGACGRFMPAHLGALQFYTQQLIQGDGGAPAEWLQRGLAADRQMHTAIASRCGSERLAYEIGRYDTLIHSLREMAGNRDGALQRSLEQFMAIFEALGAQDVDCAAAAMSAHIEAMAKVSEAVLFDSRP